MEDKTTKPDFTPVEPIQTMKVNRSNHAHRDGENSVATPPATSEVQQIPLIDVEESEEPTEKELHAHDHGSQTLEQSHRAEQQLKNQQHAQNDRELFPKGLASEHGKGRG